MSKELKEVKEFVIWRSGFGRVFQAEGINCLGTYPEVGVCVAHIRNNMEASRAGVVGTGKRVVGGEAER